MSDSNDSREIKLTKTNHLVPAQRLREFPAAAPSGMRENDEMRVLLFGSTGMVGRGVLRECLLADDVELVLAVGRTATGARNAKLREVTVADIFDVTAYERDLAGFDACFFCLGVTSAGMTEAAYTRLTYQLTTTVAEALARLNPGMTFVYVSGSGTDSSEKGRAMWARVKGRTENALLRMPFRAAYMFRPGFIEPLHGIQSKTRSYRLFYAALRPLFSFLHRAFPSWVLTTEEVGQAILIAVRRGAPKAVLESRDIRALLDSQGLD
jgi:uncharacterized protein YbjT (DUF2867 family)